jgi:hypothetical protein
MERFFRYIETQEGRNKIVNAIHTWVMVGGTIVTAILLTGVFLKYR